MREFGWRLLAASGLTRLAGIALGHRGRHVLEFHGTPSRRAEELPVNLRPCLYRDDLAAILEWLAARFQCLTPEEFFAASSPGVLLTFDDGFANQAREAVPLLEQFQVPAVVFVTTRHVADPKDWLGFARAQVDQHCTSSTSEAALAEVFDGMSAEDLVACGRSAFVTIGAHTVDHPKLTTCDDGRLRRELQDSRDFLEEHVGAPVDLLAYPFGDYDHRVAEVAREVGYRAAFVEDSRNLGLGAFEIPRIGVYRSDPAYLSLKLSGLYRRPLPIGRRLAAQVSGPQDS